MRHHECHYPGLLCRIFPFLEWVKGYQLSYFKSDLVTGITVAVVLIPQAMAYAMLAGMPPVYGLYAAAVTISVYTHLTEKAKTMAVKSK